MTLPANIRVNMSAPFPAMVKGSGPVVVAKRNGIWTVSLNYLAVGKSATVPDPANTYTLVWNPLTNVFTMLPLGSLVSAKVTKTLHLPGPYPALPSDDVLIVKQDVAAPFIVTVDWAQRTKPLRVVDGKGDADVNNITITPAAGQSQLAIVDYAYVINGRGASIILTPLPDGTGAY